MNIPTVGMQVNYRNSDGSVVAAEIQAVRQDAERAATGWDYFILTLASEQIPAGVAKEVGPALDPANPDINTWWF